MKIKQVFKIVITFVLVLSLLSLIISGSFYLIQKYMFSIEATHRYNFWEFSLYILGYGDSPTVGIGLQLFLGIIGIIMLSLLSAFLTVNLFRRAKDVLLTDNIVVRNNNDRKYIGSVAIANLGKPICNVTVAAQLFDSIGETMNIENNSYEKPIIIENHIWRIDFDISIGSFMYEFIRNKYRFDGLMKLYILVSFVDTDTGQESIIIKEFRIDNVVVVNCDKGFIYHDRKLHTNLNSELNKKRGIYWKQLKNIEEDIEYKKKFQHFICANTVRIDMQNAIPIVENGNHKAICIHHELLKDNETQVMTININFDKQYKDLSKPEFIMALIQFLPFQNWSPYFEKNYSLEFEISSSPEISFIQLEIKDKMKNKILDKNLQATEIATHYSFTLHELGSIENWMEVQEICFTVFSHDTLKSQGTYTIKDFKLVESSQAKQVELIEGI